VILRLGVLLCLAACLAGCASGTGKATAARSGKWEGTTVFGSFSFTVCEGGRKITGYRLQFKVDGATMAEARGAGKEVLIDKEGAFDLSKPEGDLIFRGQFSADGESASGVWQVTVPGGDTLAEDWIIER
jgi:hypothetical protein